jgi:hypothetical protein
VNISHSIDVLYITVEKSEQGEEKRDTRRGKEGKRGTERELKFSM